MCKFQVFLYNFFAFELNRFYFGKGILLHTFYKNNVAIN